MKLKEFSDFDAELSGLASKLQAMPRGQRNKCLVIARSNKLLAEAAKHLKQANINAEIVSRNQSIAEFDKLNSEEAKESIGNFPDYEADKENWRRILTGIQRRYGDKLNLHTLLREMDLTPESKPLPRDCIRLQTVHTAKGTEFEHVCLIGLAEEVFPAYFAIKQGEKSIEEERRNCFVAITRSSNSLYMSYAHSYFGWSKSPSRFLKEMSLLSEYTERQ